MGTHAIEPQKEEQGIRHWRLVHEAKRGSGMLTLDVAGAKICDRSMTGSAAGGVAGATAGAAATQG